MVEDIGYIKGMSKEVANMFKDAKDNQAKYFNEVRT